MGLAEEGSYLTPGGALDHRRPLSGDNGLRFEAVEGADPAYFDTNQVFIGVGIVDEPDENGKRSR